MTDMNNDVRSVQLTSNERPPLQLEGRWHLPSGTGPFPAAVVAHPHPLYGGSMHAPILVRIAHTLTAHGWGALRFNFRGVGSSQGSYDGGRGEMNDLIGALDWLVAQPQVDTDRLAIVGYSFGAWIAGRVAVQDARVSAYTAVALPMEKGFHLDLSGFDGPKCFITGARDTICPPDRLRRYVDALPEPKTLRIIPGADHFLAGLEQRVADDVSSFLTGFYAGGKHG